MFFPKKSLVSGGIWYLAVEETVAWKTSRSRGEHVTSTAPKLPQNLGTFHPGVKETWNLTFPTGALYSGWWNQLGLLFQIYGTNWKNVPNHQPVLLVYTIMDFKSGLLLWANHFHSYLVFEFCGCAGIDTNSDRHPTVVRLVAKNRYLKPSLGC